MVSVTTNERLVDFRQAQREWELLTPMFRDMLLRTDLRRRTVVDAGTGQGRLAFFLAPHVGRVVAIDVDDTALWKARQYAAFKGIGNVDFLLADLEAEPFRKIYDGPIDAIVSSFYMSEAFLWRATAAMPVGSLLMFCCHHADHWKETGMQARHAYTVEELEDLLREDFFEPEVLGVEQHVIRFGSMNEVEMFLGGRKLQEWMEDGRWDAMKGRFDRGDTQLTLSYLVGKARRGPGSHW